MVIEANSNGITITKPSILDYAEAGIKNLDEKLIAADHKLSEIDERLNDITLADVLIWWRKKKAKLKS